MKFVKMHGTGNDYIFVDCFKMSVDDMPGLAAQMSNRHFGVGGDGVIYMYPSFVADVRMRMFNADGSEGAMCGNAVRCIARLLYEQTGKNEFTVETNAGIKAVTYDRVSDLFTVDMGKPQISEAKPIFVCGQHYEYTYVSMGNPHCVVFVESIDKISSAVGDAMENHSFFPDGINAEFVEGKGNNIRVRVFERGTGETMSCGTGACAAVAASVAAGRCERKTDIIVSLKGGDLKVNFDENIYLTGNAVKIYEGDYYDKIHFCDRRSCKRFG